MVTMVASAGEADDYWQSSAYSIEVPAVWILPLSAAAFRPFLVSLKVDLLAQKSAGCQSWRALRGQCQDPLGCDQHGKSGA